mmetsp:Transcript_25292/g.66129  ORF Transcript_25292/g.66129 Transcript_25292/m.66129 type:complete len:224 (-) Transcript_25292:291-962(-)
MAPKRPRSSVLSSSINSTALMSMCPVGARALSTRVGNCMRSAWYDRFRSLRRFRSSTLCDLRLLSGSSSSSPEFGHDGGAGLPRVGVITVSAFASRSVDFFRLLLAPLPLFRRRGVVVMAVGVVLLSSSRLMSSSDEASGVKGGVLKAKVNRDAAAACPVDGGGEAGGVAHVLAAREVPTAEPRRAPVEPIRSTTASLASCAKENCSSSDDPENGGGVRIDDE